VGAITRGVGNQGRGPGRLPGLRPARSLDHPHPGRTFGPEDREETIIATAATAAASDDAGPPPPGGGTLSDAVKAEVKRFVMGLMPREPKSKKKDKVQKTRVSINPGTVLLLTFSKEAAASVQAKITGPSGVTKKYSSSLVHSSNANAGKANAGRRPRGVVGRTNASRSGRFAWSWPRQRDNSSNRRSQRGRRRDRRS
jgi:hypothetical protein